MRTQRIEILLEKFFEGETTLTEEAEIRDFFISHSDIPSHLELYRIYFTGVEKQRKSHTDLKKIKHVIYNLQEKERPNHFRKQLFKWSGFAAAAIVSTMLTFNIWQESQHSSDIQFASEMTDEERYEIATNAMRYLTGNYYKGVSQLQKIPDVNKETNTFMNALNIYNRGYNMMEVITTINIK